MVTTVSNLGRSGLFDWVIQRASAVVLAAYTIFIVSFIVTHPQLDFATWRALFDQLWVRIFSLLALISTAAHGWIGLWAVLTDYVTERMMGAKALALRTLALGAYAIVTLSYLVWGFEILWGF
jgi:succinate dehydrogenase / fumarate reductase membrane anchor subunit